MRRHLVVAVAVLLTACSPADEADEARPASTVTTTTIATTTTAPRPVEFAVTSPAFAENGTIPVEHTCDGADTSPQLNVVGLPPLTQYAAVVVADPDAPLGTWYHWVEFDIPVDGSRLTIPEDAPTLGVGGLNSWNLEGYMGPCPPEGEKHRYVFTVYALTTSLDLPEGVNAESVESALEDAAVASVELTGNYSR